MSKRGIVSSLLLVLLLVSFTHTQSGQKSLYVLAVSGLNMRSKPQLGAPVLVNVPYGAKVTKLSTAPEAGKLTVDNITAGWFKVQYGDKVGYMFSGYLCPYPAPKKGTTHIRDYISQSFKQIGSPVTKAEGGNGEMESTSTTTRYEKEILFSKNTYDEGGWITIHFPDLGLEQAYILARLCGTPYVTQINYPTEDTNIIIEEEDQLISITVTKDEGRITKIEFRGPYDWVVFYEGDEGAADIEIGSGT